MSRGAFSRLFTRRTTAVTYEGAELASLAAALVEAAEAVPDQGWITPWGVYAHSGGFSVVRGYAQRASTEHGGTVDTFFWTLEDGSIAVRIPDSSMGSVKPQECSPHDLPVTRIEVTTEPESSL